MALQGSGTGEAPFSSGRAEQGNKPRRWLMKSLASAMGGKQNKAQGLEKTEALVDLQVGKTLWEDVPRDMRKELWLSILARNGRGTNLGTLYIKLQAAVIPEEVDETITKDCHRSFPNHEIFSEKENQDALYRVLRAYAAYDPEVGYCQGMNFVAAVLLLHLLPHESDCFAAMVVLMQERGLRGHYTVDMRMLQIRLWQMGEVMPPRLKAHLERCGVLPVLYASPWFLTIFSNEFPISFVGRVFDVLLSESDDSLLMKVAVCIMSELEPDLLGETDLEALLYLIKNAPPAWGKNRLRKVMSNAMVHHWRAKEKEKFTAEAEKSAETVKEAVERTDRIREQRAGSTSELSEQTEPGQEAEVGAPDVPHRSWEDSPVPRLVPPPPSSASDSTLDLISLDDAPPPTAAVWSALGSASAGREDPVDPFAACGASLALDDSQLTGIGYAHSPPPRDPQGLAGSSLTYMAPPASRTKSGIAAAIATPLAEIQRQPTGDSVASYGSFQAARAPSCGEASLLQLDSFSSFQGAEPATEPSPPARPNGCSPTTPAWNLSSVQQALVADIRVPVEDIRSPESGLYSRYMSDPSALITSSPNSSPAKPRSMAPDHPRGAGSATIGGSGPEGYSGWLGK